MSAVKDFIHIQPKTVEYGWAFEHFILNELRAYLSYKEKYLPLSYWRTTTGLEVDIIAGNLDLAIEIKANDNTSINDLKGLKALIEDRNVKRPIVVSLDKQKRLIDKDIMIYGKIN